MVITKTGIEKENNINKRLNYKLKEGVYIDIFHKFKWLIWLIIIRAKRNIEWNIETTLKEL